MTYKHTCHECGDTGLEHTEMRCDPRDDGFVCIDCRSEIDATRTHLMRELGLKIRLDHDGKFRFYR